MIRSHSHPNIMTKSRLQVVSQRPFGILLFIGEWLLDDQKVIQFHVGGVMHCTKPYGHKAKTALQSFLTYYIYLSTHFT